MHWKTRLIQSRPEVPQGFRSLAAATYRGSTIVFESQARVSDDWHQADRDIHMAPSEHPQR